MDQLNSIVSKHPDATVGDVVMVLGFPCVHEVEGGDEHWTYWPRGQVAPRIHAWRNDGEDVVYLLVNLHREDGTEVRVDVEAPTLGEAAVKWMDTASLDAPRLFALVVDGMARGEAA